MFFAVAVELPFIALRPHVLNVEPFKELVVSRRFHYLVGQIALPQYYWHFSWEGLVFTNSILGKLLKGFFIYCFSGH